MYFVIPVSIKDAEPINNVVKWGHTDTFIRVVKIKGKFAGIYCVYGIECVSYINAEHKKC